MPAAPTHGAPGRGPSLGDGGAAPPIDPDDENQNRDALAGGEAGAEPVRAEAWVPDANLMRALGLELTELRPGPEAGEPGETDEPRRSLTAPRPEPGASGTAGAPGAPDPSGEPAAPRSPTADGRPPWW